MPLLAAFGRNSSRAFRGAGRLVFNITISADTTDYVLNTAKVTGYVAGAMDVVLTINSGIYVGSTSTATPGLDIDTSWAAGDKITIVNNGFIVGRGGNGGNGQFTNTAATVGGPALRAQRAVSVNNLGTIGGGGGGGGGGAAWDNGGITTGGGGGGGGQGFTGGTGGSGGSGTTASGGAGGAGTKTSAGSGGPRGDPNGVSVGGTGGTGGTLGQAGSAGGTAASPSSGGTAGAAGGNCTTAGSNANITWITTGTRLGTVA